MASLISMYKLFSNLATSDKTRDQLAAAIGTGPAAVKTFAMTDDTMIADHADEFVRQAQTILASGKKIGAFPPAAVDLWTNGYSLSLYLCQPSWARDFPHQDYPVFHAYKDENGVDCEYVYWSPVEMNFAPLALLNAISTTRKQLTDMSQRDHLLTSSRLQLLARTQSLI